jgi:hypothetical protein
MARKFPYTGLPCAEEINAAFHRIESILNVMSNREDIDYVQDSFIGSGKSPSSPRFIPPGDTLPDLWGNLYNAGLYKGKELYYDNVGTLDPQGIITIDTISPSVLVSIAQVWSNL